MSDKQDTAKKGLFHKGNQKVIVLATGLAIVMAGVFGVQAFADSKTYQHLKHYAAYKGKEHGGRYGRDHKGFAQLSDAEVESRVTRMVKHAAIEIDATQEQQDKIIALVTAVAKDLKPVIVRMRGARKEIHELLLADKVDRSKLEKLRAERFADAERASKELVDAIADVAGVLSLEQRKLLDERIKQFRGMRRGWHRG